MTDFGNLVLLIGDFHVPQRKPDIPACFRELLQTDKIGQVLVTGNMTYQQLQGIIPNVAPADCHIVAGDGDPDSLPESLVVTIGSLKVGVMHGHQVIPWGDQIAQFTTLGELGVNILVTGHTHQTCVWPDPSNKRFVINPGSVTGAANSNGDEYNPSFMLMAVQESSVVLYTYSAVDGETKVEMNSLDF
eukprot:CAMPEP_0194480884 /NCGR_PEP_ID=MMETSP0253-20130528/3541_1 /TAXON_ID=2966 /ORGANISM="Noctiluca scintillans" /LENGTH=188 /DNA_ID=CAMNT_0039320327 /DNA_START=69 /DNA_END=635 /DNA_ORIENTATION=+